MRKHIYYSCLKHALQICIKVVFQSFPVEDAEMELLGWTDYFYTLSTFLLGLHQNNRIMEYKLAIHALERLKVFIIFCFVSIWLRIYPSVKHVTKCVLAFYETITLL